MFILLILLKVSLIFKLIDSHGILLDPEPRNFNYLNQGYRLTARPYNRFDLRSGSFDFQYLIHGKKNKLV